jgi:MerR family transcriptional regulator, light-induced transcriptional regulator
MANQNGYLRIGELAKRTGTSPELLRAWELRYGLLRPSRSAGGFRLYSEDDKAKILRTKQLIASGLSAAEAARQAVTGETVTEDATPVLEGLADDLRDALDRFDEDGANRALDRLIAAASVETVMREVLLPYLRILGDRWARGDVSVAQEHFASALLRGRLLGLARGWGTGSGPTLVLACPPGEQHDLGLIMFGIAASRRGRRITYLGQDTPFSTIGATVDAVGPDLVVFGVAEGTSLGEHARAIRALAKRVPVAIGGAGITKDEARGLGVLLLEGDPVEAAGALSD